jgi:hypothetical protein
MRCTAYRAALPCLLSAALGAASPARADDSGAKVQKAQDAGVAYLKHMQTDEGHWEKDTLSLIMPGGNSALALLALLETGLKPDDPAVERGLKYLRAVEPKHTYIVALQTQVLVRAN